MDIINEELNKICLVTKLNVPVHKAYCDNRYWRIYSGHFWEWLLWDIPDIDCFCPLINSQSSGVVSGKQEIARKLQELDMFQAEQWLIQFRFYCVYSYIGIYISLDTPVLC